jgi:hypothetical protein
MGEDITAPSGAEWFSAWKLERSILPLRKSNKPTPAGQDFMRLYPGQWTSFTTSNELARIITLDLIRILLHATNRYGLTVTEMEALTAHAERFRGLNGEPLPEPGGAEGGGVLLDLGHREPVDGVALDELR